MDFFHFATTNARNQFQPRDIDADDDQRIRERNEAIVLRYLRSDEPAWLRMVNPLHGWGEDTGK